MDSGDIHVSWRRWKDTFIAIMETCIPRILLPSRHNLPWLSKPLIQMIRKRNVLYKRARLPNDPEIALKYRTVRNKLVSELRIAKKKYFSELDPKRQSTFGKP